MYTILVFTPWVDDVIIKFQVGYVTCTFVVIHLVVNFFLIFRASFFTCHHGCRKRRAKNKFKVERKERQAYLAESQGKRWKLRKSNKKEEARFVLARLNADLNRQLMPIAEDTTAAAKGKINTAGDNYIPQTGLNELIQTKSSKTVTFSTIVTQIRDN